MCVLCQIWYKCQPVVWQGAPVAEWLGSLTPNQQAVTNVDSKLMCHILGTCPDMTLAVERDVKQQQLVCCVTNSASPLVHLSPAFLVLSPVLCLSGFCCSNLTVMSGEWGIPPTRRGGGNMLWQRYHDRYHVKSGTSAKSKLETNLLSDKFSLSTCTSVPSFCSSVSSPLSGFCNSNVTDVWWVRDPPHLGRKRGNMLTWHTI